MVPSVDLILCSPSIFLYFSWDDGPDFCGSDNFSIILENDRPSWKRSKREVDKGKQGSITASVPALVFINQSLLMLLIACLRSLPSWRTLQRKLFLKRFNKPLYSDICKEENVLFNDTQNTFYLRLYSVEHMVKDHSDSERGNPLPPHGLLFPISSKGSFICTIPQIR